MPRDGSGVYSTPPGTAAITNTPVLSTPYNGNVADVAQDLNVPRPIVAGGTGATTAHDAMVALKGEIALQIVTNFDSDPLVPGSFYAAAGATTAPVAGHNFIGIIYGDAAGTLTVEARDFNDSVVPGTMYVRTRQGGTWGAWAQATAAVNAAKVNRAGDTMTGPLVVNSNISVGGTATVSNILYANNTATITGTLTVTNGHCNVQYDITCRNLTSSGNVQAGQFYINGHLLAQGSDDYNVLYGADTGTAIFLGNAGGSSPQSYYVAPKHGFYGPGFTPAILDMQPTASTFFVPLTVSGALTLNNPTGAIAARFTGTGTGAASYDWSNTTSGQFSLNNASTAQLCFTIEPSLFNLVTPSSLYLKNAPCLTRGTPYTNFLGDEGSIHFIIGSSGDPSNYHRNTTHRFQATDGTSFAYVDANGLTVNSGSGIVWITGQGYKPGGGAWADTSDARIKDVLGDYESGLDQILALNPKRFVYKGNDTREPPSNNQQGPGQTEDKSTPTVPYKNSGHYNAATESKEFIGLIAQDTEGAMPELVSQHEGYIDGQHVTDLRNVDTTPLIFALVNAVKQLAARVAELEAA
jgi:Chaperone of endosialidase